VTGTRGVRYPAPVLTFDDGVHLVGTSVFLDSRKAKPRAIVTHAHSDHVARHRRWVTSPATGALCARRWGARDVETHAFGVPWDDDGARVTLLPAGHILGSAMVLLERAGTRVLYTGDFRLRASATAEPCTPVAADVLVMECTYGDPRYRFPPVERVLDDLDQFIATAHTRALTPVLLAYSLGKAQEVARLVSRRGHDVWLTPGAHAMLDVYRELGVAYERCHRFDPDDASTAPGRGVLILPPGSRRREALAHVPRRLTAYLSGWAIGPPGWRPRHDVAFPLSDHADFDELIEMVQRVRPRQVFTLHGPDRFAHTLRARGIDATPARHALQMSLL
jgi:Cft2 family RNA processing exonuclease